MTLVMVVGLGRPPSRAIQLSPWFMCQRENSKVSVMYRYTTLEILIFLSLIHTEMRISGDGDLSILYGLKLSFDDWLRSLNRYW